MTPSEQAEVQIAEAQRIARWLRKEANQSLRRAGTYPDGHPSKPIHLGANLALEDAAQAVESAP